jgi:hypothetical protein
MIEQSAAPRVGARRRRPAGTSHVEAATDRRRAFRHLLSAFAVRGHDSQRSGSSAQIDEAMMAAVLGGASGWSPPVAPRWNPRLLEAEAARAEERRGGLVFVDEALAALLAGNGGTHDRLVKDAVLALAERNDVVVLAQASMARADGDRREFARGPDPVSPHLALAQVRMLLASHRT